MVLKVIISFRKILLELLFDFLTKINPLRNIYEIYKINQHITNTDSACIERLK